MEKIGTAGISGFTLKWIAMIAMLVDHVGAVLYPQHIIFRIIGRIAFPVFCFLLVEGAVHTRDIRSYEKRLFLFALISEVPFDLVFYGSVGLQHQNVFFTLLAGLIMLDVLKKNMGVIFEIAAVAGAMLASEVMGSDYGAYGIIIIICFYALYQKRLGKQIAFAGINYLYYGGGIQVYAGLAAIPLLLYNGTRGPKMKYFFYVFYPLHLLILYLIIK